jgi:DNA-binding phage protein
MREMGNWREYQIRRLANDQEAAIDYLQLTLEEYHTDGDLTFFLKELRVFIASQGGVVEICKQTGIDTETLLNMLSNEDATQLLDTFSSLLNALKHRLVIEDAHAKHLAPAKQIPTS